MDVPTDGDAPQQGRQLGQSAECDDRSRLRKEGEDQLSQRLFSIILAVHAAKNDLGKNPSRLAEILALIQAQSAASLDDLRRLGTLR